MELELSKREKGDFAEEKASEYLVEKGYKILKRNFQFGKVGEIDIVAQKDNIISFVEVRSKQNPFTPDPLTMLSPKKITSIRKTAEGYIYVNKAECNGFQCDLIIIDSTTQPIKIKHIENAF